MSYLKGLLDKLEPFILENSSKHYLYTSKGKPDRIFYSLSNFSKFLNDLIPGLGKQFYKIPSDLVMYELNISNDFLHRVIVGKWNILEFTKNTDGAKARRYFYYDQVMELSIFLEHYKLFRLVNDQVFQQAFPKKSHRSFKKFYDEFIDGKDIYSDRIKIFCKNVLEGKYEKGSK